MTNYLKKSWLMMFALPVLAGGLMSCSDDDGYSAVDNQVPTIMLPSDHIGWQTVHHRGNSQGCRWYQVYQSEKRGDDARQDHQPA